MRPSLLYIMYLLRDAPNWRQNWARNTEKNAGKSAQNNNSSVTSQKRAESKAVTPKSRAPEIFALRCNGDM